MSRIRKTNTKAELALRRYMWGRNLRGYRLNSKTIIGSPDLYFPRKKLAIFVDGCFWHKCIQCFRKPKSNNDYWDRKIKYNVERDKKNNKTLDSKKIVYLRLWEHEVHGNIEECFERIIKIYINL